MAPNNSYMPMAFADSQLTQQRGEYQPIPATYNSANPPCSALLHSTNPPGLRTTSSQLHEFQLTYQAKNETRHKTKMQSDRNLLRSSRQRANLIAKKVKCFVTSDPDGKTVSVEVTIIVIRDPRHPPRHRHQLPLQRYYAALLPTRGSHRRRLGARQLLLGIRFPPMRDGLSNG
jgi:hypothetical protein